jgi:hypothetical protein
MGFRLDAYLKDCNRAPEALGLKKSAIEIYVYGLTIIGKFNHIVVYCQ